MTPKIFRFQFRPGIADPLTIQQSNESDLWIIDISDKATRRYIESYIDFFTEIDSILLTDCIQKRFGKCHEDVKADLVLTEIPPASWSWADWRSQLFKAKIRKPGCLHIVSVLLQDMLQKKESS